MESSHYTAVRSTRAKFIPIIGAAAGLTVIGALVAYFGADAVIRSLLTIGADGFAAICLIHLALNPNSISCRRATTPCWRAASSHNAECDGCGIWAPMGYQRPQRAEIRPLGSGRRWPSANRCDTRGGTRTR